jgi:hypothetical protein
MLLQQMLEDRAQTHKRFHQNNQLQINTSVIIGRTFTLRETPLVIVTLLLHRSSSGLSPECRKGAQIGIIGEQCNCKSCF